MNDHSDAWDDPIGLDMIAAVGRRGELGRDGQLLFKLKADMENFRRVTAGHPIVMGRKTWDSFPKRPLPGRPNIIVTRNAEFLAPGAFVLSSLPAALAAARAMAARRGLSKAYVLGGGEIYAAALPYATHMTLTEVNTETEADSFFPSFNPGEWRELSRVTHSADANNEVGFVIRELERL